MSKPLNYKNPDTLMSLEDATTYLKRLGEWESVWKLDRETIIGWAEFLKKKEIPVNDKKTPTRKTIKKI